MKKITHTALTLVLFPLLLISARLYSQDVKLNKGTVLHVKLHGKTLEGNLEGDSIDRSLAIYLPASYKINPKRHYPVVYFLHGFTDNDSKWYGLTKHWINLPAILDTVFSQGGAKEMIFVTPDADTRYRGSMYSNSITTGNWEDFVAKELVAYMDTHYRTIAKTSSRGLAGHSMGGYGTMRIGERNPNVFSSIYLLSPASLAPVMAPLSTEQMNAIEAVKTFDDFNKADFFTKYLFASAAAWSPNTNKPPFYSDFPFADGQMLPAIQAKWIANAPLASLDQYIYNLKQLHAIAFDAGDNDIPGIANSITVLDSELNKYGIKHSFEIYPGTHISHIGQRISQKVISFFSDNLAF
ncbi:alpha/beta hydrolase [Mucilaginibacter paludis]|uniref:Esterase n=1 Tax=Mucilaginibacter paludis DSM 18603 TaxID=714943 RepID=H1YFY4_9SPHI|nr:alpha/beta hydrolase-fold protein [Mucilaginibacter paludis]EHQ26272.1 esterase [Mucilaginibacter paludis DSM 18603]